MTKCHSIFPKNQKRHIKMYKLREFQGVPGTFRRPEYHHWIRNFNPECVRWRHHDVINILMMFWKDPLCMIDLRYHHSRIPFRSWKYLAIFSQKVELYVVVSCRQNRYCVFSEHKNNNIHQYSGLSKTDLITKWRNMRLYWAKLPTGRYFSPFTHTSPFEMVFFWHILEQWTYLRYFECWIHDKCYSGASKITLFVIDAKIPTGRYFWPSFSKCTNINEVLSVQPTIMDQNMHNTCIFHGNINI